MMCEYARTVSVRFHDKKPLAYYSSWKEQSEEEGTDHDGRSEHFVDGGTHCRTQESATQSNCVRRSEASREN
eukprot:scaffold31315_cov49-Attheya_sp.AAC.4